MILLLGAGLLFAGRHAGPVHHRRGDLRATRRRPLGGRDPGDDAAPERSPRTSSSVRSPSASSARWATVRRLGRKLVRADTAKKIQHRLDIAGNPPAGTSTGSSVSRCSAWASSACSASSTSSAWAGRFYRVVARHGAARGLRLRPAQHPALQRRRRSARADAQRAARRPGPADGLGRGRPRLRRRRRPGGARTPTARWRRSSPACCRRCRSAWAAPRPCAPWPSARRSPTSSRSASPWCRPTASASRSAGCCASRASEMRTKRRQRAEEKAQKVPVQDHDPAGALHPALPVHRHHGPGWHLRSPTRSADRDACDSRASTDPGARPAAADVAGRRPRSGSSRSPWPRARVVSDRARSASPRPCSWCSRSSPRVASRRWSGTPRPRHATGSPSARRCSWRLVLAERDSIPALLRLPRRPAVVAGVRHGLVTTLNATLRRRPWPQSATVAATPTGDVAACSRRRALAASSGSASGCWPAGSPRSVRDLEARQAPYAAAHQLMARLHQLASRGDLGPRQRHRWPPSSTPPCATATGCCAARTVFVVDA